MNQQKKPVLFQTNLYKNIPLCTRVVFGLVSVITLRVLAGCKLELRSLEAPAGLPLFRRGGEEADLTAMERGLVPVLPAVQYLG